MDKVSRMQIPYILCSTESAGHLYNVLELRSGHSSKPPTTALPAPLTHRDGSVEYDEPLMSSRRLPALPVATKPCQPPSPQYHILEDPLSSLKTFSRTSPLSTPPAPTKLARPSSPQYHILEDPMSMSSLRSLPRDLSHTTPMTAPIPLSTPPVATKSARPSSPKYHVLEDPLSSLRGFSHVSTPTAVPVIPPLTPASADWISHQSSPSLSLSFDRCRVDHSRGPSSVSEYDTIQPLTPSHVEYEVTQPPHWNKTGKLLRSISLASSSQTLGSHSRTSSLATIGDNVPPDHVYHQLTTLEV